MRKQIKTVWIVVCVCVCGWSIDAEAYSRDKSDLGTPLQWTQSPVPYVFDARGLGDHFVKNPRWGREGSEKTAMTAAFQTWERTTCNGASPGFRFQYGGEVTGKKAGLDKNCLSCNTNLVIFQSSAEQWTHDRLEVAVTTTSFSQASGQIVDADIEFNAAFFQFSTASQNPDDIRWDVQAVMTHEIGHFLGLGHSQDAKATMYAQGNPKDLGMRTLSPDDITGICAVYPPPQALGQVPSYNQSDSDRALGCATQGQSTDVSILALFFLLFGLLGVRLRRLHVQLTKRWEERMPWSRAELGEESKTQKDKAKV